MPLLVKEHTVLLRLLTLALLAAAFGVAADPPIPTVTVCEVLADLPAHEGKDVAVLGRFSFRRDGRWIGEQSCEDCERRSADAVADGRFGGGAEASRQLRVRFAC